MLSDRLATAAADDPVGDRDEHRVGVRHPDRSGRSRRSPARPAGRTSTYRGTVSQLPVWPAPAAIALPQATWNGTLTSCARDRSVDAVADRYHLGDALVPESKLPADGTLPRRSPDRGRRSRPPPDARSPRRHLRAPARRLLPFELPGSMNVSWRIAAPTPTAGRPTGGINRDVVPMSAFDLPRRPADRGRGLRARGPRPRVRARVHPALDGHPPARRRRGGDRRGRRLRRPRPHRAPRRRAGHDFSGAGDPRRALRPARRARPVRGRAARARAVAPLPPLGLRERRARPRPAPERALAARGAGPRAAAGQFVCSTRLRSFGDDARSTTEPIRKRLAKLPRPALQARPRERLDAAS